MKKSLMIISFVIFVLACQSIAPSPTSTPQPTQTPQPTETSVPTSTPTFTPIPPTPTLQPPSILLELFNDAQILYIDQLNDINNWFTWNAQTSKLIDGAVEIQGQPDWTGGFVHSKKLREGMGVVIEFKNTSGTEYEFVVNTGNWNTDTFRSFGIYGGKSPRADLWQGMNNIGGNYLRGNLSLTKDQWYGVVIAISKDREFFAEIWDLNTPTHGAIYREILNEKWVGKDWEFLLQTNTGTTLHIDNFSSFSFSSIK